MDALVAGAGAMGRWFGRAVADEAEVAYADVDPAAAEAAAVETGGRAVALDGEESFDAVCLAVPIPAVEAAIEAQAGRAERALLDVSGVMGDPVAAMAAAAPDCERVSLHPLFAPEHEPGNVAVVADAPGPVTDDLRAAIATRGNDCFETTPGEHDTAMETVQAAAHAAVLAYGLAAEAVPPAFHTPVSAALAEVVEQVTGGEPRVYADIQSAFDGADAVAEAARRLADADDEAFADLYAAARVEGPSVPPGDAASGADAGDAPAASGDADDGEGH
jgi:prephenate dehydrogenase